MSVKMITWDVDKTKREVLKRWKHAQDARRPHEDKWARNEASVYGTSSASSGLQVSASGVDIQFQGVDSGNSESATSYTFKNFRFIHAQMSSNPPSVVMRPQTSDQDDHRKADAADRIVRWSTRQYEMQENTDQMSLQTLLYGIGVMKTVWDSTRGAILDFNTDTDEMQLEGDIAITVPFVWNIYVDPDARTAKDIKWVIERIYLDYDEACARWPDRADALKKARVEKDSGQTSGNDTNLQNDHYNAVELLEYWETGLPTNGYMGRYCIVTSQGEEIEPCRSNPFRFREAGAVQRIELDMELSDLEKGYKVSKLRERARLPYHILTDIDIPNSILGKSMVEYASQLQDNLNRLDTARLENLEANAVNRLIVPESAQLADDAITNTVWDIVPIAGNQPPYFMAPAQPNPDLTPTRLDTIQGINDVMGTNENQFGQQSREQSGASMQFAVNQGNMVRRRLFNKYVLVVEGIYRAILDLVRKHWTTERTIHVLGKEKALEAIDVKGTDIDGGYDVVGEYGVSFSLDPITRRQEVITMQPLFEKAGIPARTALRLLKLSDLEGLHDKLDLAGNRQKEIFDEMVATGAYIAPEDLMDHENMIAWALDYFMTSEFTMLPAEVKVLLKQHTRDRVSLAAQERSGLATAPQAVPPAPGEVQAPAPVVPQ